MQGQMTNKTKFDMIFKHLVLGVIVIDVKVEKCIGQYSSWYCVCVCIVCMCVYAYVFACA